MWRTWRRPVAWLALLLLAAGSIPHLGLLFHYLQPDARSVVYDRQSFFWLLRSHILLVLASGLLSTVAAVTAGILVTRSWGRDFLPLANQVAAIGQTFPPVAVLALAVPALGFGAAPTVVALFLYGLLPILRNTLAGLDGISPTVLEAAVGMGMSPLQVLVGIELPLATRVILAGVRTSITINIATAAIGSTIGARTLGDPVIAGLINGNTAYVLQGAILIGLLAVTADSFFEAVQLTLDRLRAPSAVVA